MSAVKVVPRLPKLDESAGPRGIDRIAATEAELLMRRLMSVTPNESRVQASWERLKTLMRLRAGRAAGVETRKERK